MSALLNTADATFEPMTDAQLGDVVALEQQVYDHPWTHGNFVDSLRAGYHARVLVAGGELLGYYVAMKGVDEVHLLTITVAPARRRRGGGRGGRGARAGGARAGAARGGGREGRAGGGRARRI